MSDASPSEEVAGFAADAPETGGRTLVEGATFVVSGPGGDIDGGGGAQGLFVRDARLLSRWQLSVDGEELEPLGGSSREPFSGVFLARAAPRAGRAEPTVIVERRRYLGAGMREDIVVHNFGSEPAGISLSLQVGCDLADLFEVKGGRLPEAREVHVETDPEHWTARGRHGTSERAVTVTAPGAAVGTETLTWRAVVPVRGIWETSLEVSASIDGVRLPPRFALGAPPEGAAPVRGLAQWRRESPTLQTGSPSLAAAFARSQTDLAALRIVDPAAPELPAVAAGAPWFMALFGRDSLITASMTLPTHPDLAVGTLRALALHQGTSVDPLTEEEPGRIVHELRLGADPALALGGTDRYYGSVDATPLFVVLLGQLARWGADPDVVDELLPAADRALEWVERYGDRDRDGLVEYARPTDRGLLHQGWKDSLDGINFADGTLAEPPIALVEVQGYVYAAYRARAEIAERRGELGTAGECRERARAVRQRIDESFWLPGPGYYAVGLDAEKRPIDALASNMGHLLWTGAADEAKAAKVADRLVSPEMWSGFGIRTLAATMGAYNPVSYHNGSTWPHDTALAVAGLARYGHHRHAQRVAAGLVDAAAYFSGRLPELFCGFARAEHPAPVPYPNACSPQAWASAAPMALLCALLGIDPDVPAGTLTVAPCVPPQWGRVRLERVPVGSEHLSILAEPDGTWEATGAASLRLERRGDRTEPSCEPLRVSRSSGSSRRRARGSR